MSDLRIVLVHSPLLGPSAWQWAATSLREAGHDVLVPSMLGFERTGPPYWTGFVRSLVAACGAEDRLVLVGHSGAGLLLPAIVGELGTRVQRVVYVEAALAPEAGVVELAPQWLLDHLRPLAVGGTLPPWSQWWGRDAMKTLVPDPERRGTIVSELPRLPYRYLEERVPVPDRWGERVEPCMLWFSDAYEGDAADAAHRGWPVHRIPGGHLHMAVDPDAVGHAVAAMLT